MSDVHLVNDAFVDVLLRFAADLLTRLALFLRALPFLHFFNDLFYIQWSTGQDIRTILRISQRSPQAPP